jgi:RHS repeat-associated protein
MGQPPTNGKCVTYDAFGRMVEISSGSAWTEFWYTQVPGNRISMNGTTNGYAYWPSPGRGTYVYGPGYAWFLHPDWLGNDRVVSSLGNHAVFADRAYAPYGERYNTFGDTNPIYGIFAGNSGDYDSGVLFDTPNRELAYAQGRWISPDPAGAGWNLYAYATNPNSEIDPSGLGGTSYSYSDGDFNGCGANAVSCSTAVDETIALQGMYDADCPTCSRGILTTTSWVNGNINYESVVDTSGNVYLDTYTGVGLANPTRGPLGAPSDGQWHISSDPAWNLVSATFGAPGAALNAAVCSGNLYCGVGLGLVLIAVGEGLGGTSVADAEILDASAIRFSQNSVNDLAPIVQSMADNGWVGDPITIVRMPDGGLTTVDNTRLMAASLTDTPVQANIIDASAPIDPAQAVRFVGEDGSLPGTWGEAVANRIANQTGGFGNIYPNGSPYTGVP